jgi:hypothetical protein
VRRRRDSGMGRSRREGKRHGHRRGGWDEVKMQQEFSPELREERRGSPEPRRRVLRNELEVS